MALWDGAVAQNISHDKTVAFREILMPAFVTEKYTTIVKSDKNLGNGGNNPQRATPSERAIL